MFVTGEGGTGKSNISTNGIHASVMGSKKGLYGSGLSMGPTGSAANIVHGLWQAVYEGRESQNGIIIIITVSCHLQQQKQ
jgi:hypothetical protein